MSIGPQSRIHDQLVFHVTRLNVSGHVTCRNIQRHEGRTQICNAYKEKKLQTGVNESCMHACMHADIRTLHFSFTFTFMHVLYTCYMYIYVYVYVCVTLHYIHPYVYAQFFPLFCHGSSARRWQVYHCQGLFNTAAVLAHNGQDLMAHWDPPMAH